MVKKERLALKAESEKWFDVSAELFSFAREALKQKKSVEKMIQTLVRREKDPDNAYPEGWFFHMVESFVFGEAFTDSATIKKLRRTASEQGERKIQEILDIFLTHPMRWGPFEVEEQLGEDLFTIYDYETETTETLYSPAITGLLRSPENRRKLHVVLRCFTGSCWITYGAFHSFSLTGFDMMQWATLLDRLVFETKGFTALVQRHFLDFFSIDEITMNPVVMHRGERLCQCIRIFEETEFDGSLLVGTWHMSTSGEQLIKCGFAGITDRERKAVVVPKQVLNRFNKTTNDYWDSEGMRFPTIYYHSKERTLVLSSFTASGYDMLYRLVKASQVGFDPNGTGGVPSWQITSSLDMHIRQQPHITTPWQRYIDPFMESQNEEEEDDLLDEEGPFDRGAFNTALQVIQESYNNGKPINAEEIARKSGLSLETVNALIDNFSAMMKKNVLHIEIPEKDSPFLLAVEEPSPHKKRLFKTSLFESDLFEVHDDQSLRDTFGVLTAEKYAKLVETEGLLGVVSDLFTDAFEDFDTTVMNSLFFLFSLYGETWTPVRSYAVTIIKWFGQVLLSPSNDDYEAFIAFFSNFVLRSLCTHALCEPQDRPTKEQRATGDYTIRATIFFEDFIDMKGPLM